MNRVSIGLSLLAFTSVSAQTPAALPDSGLAFSPDSSYVAFVRPTPGRLVPTGQENVQATELWIARRNGDAPRRLLVGHAASDMRFVLAGLHSPAFSADGRRIFILSDAWVTSDALHVVSVRTGQEHYIAPANTLEVIPTGSYRGCLLVEQHRHWMAGGSFDWLWLIGQDGHDIGPVADTFGGDFQSRLADWRHSLVTGSGSKSQQSCATRS
jgi:hypothetical protein